jgi:ribosomal protein L7/L12
MQLTQDQINNIADRIAHNEKINAIRLLREATGFQLKTCKHIIDTYEMNHPGADKFTKDMFEKGIDEEETMKEDLSHMQSRLSSFLMQHGYEVVKASLKAAHVELMDVD